MSRFHVYQDVGDWYVLDRRTNVVEQHPSRRSALDAATMLEENGSLSLIYEPGRVRVVDDNDLPTQTQLSELHNQACDNLRNAQILVQQTQAAKRATIRTSVGHSNGEDGS